MQGYLETGTKDSLEGSKDPERLLLYIYTFQRDCVKV